MQKEEFPIFLNEQPKVIFGRTGRELLIIVLGVVGSYALWGSISGLSPQSWWKPLCGVLCALLFLGAVIFSMISIGNRPLEIWIAAWLGYTLTPRLFLYQQLDEEGEDMEVPPEARGPRQPEQAIFEQ